MEFGEIELAHLYNESVLCKVGQLDADEKLDLARSGEYSNELKNLVLGSAKNMRIDKFLILHIRLLAISIKILNVHKSSSSNEENDNIEGIIFINETETWEEKKDKYMNHDKYLGGLCPDSEDQCVMVQNTCVFDSMTQSLLVAYCDRIKYHNYVNDTSSPIFNFIELLSQDGVSQKIYKNRTLILKNTLQPQNMIMDCAYIVYNSFGKIEIFQKLAKFYCFKVCKNTKKPIFSDSLRY
ncbi:hypothetical protein PV328_000952 [Microctonus aethiopoides]|uniref:Uncharacterized protein n=1 Tax=Microctonus aethiopoides TaxID=144406 RepID=A0AA39FVX5_9HYME|nr:hypothetical protein PV328_000952 [Microctonus aethiopoides]